MMYKIKKILVPTDFSDNAATAYTIAYRIAKRYKAQVDFIHIIKTLNYYTRSLAKLEVPDKANDKLYPQLIQQARHKTERAMSDYLNPDQKGEAIVEIASNPSLAIANYAAYNAYDLIVMATLGADDSNFLIGSVAEKVVRYSKVPVLTSGTSDFDTVDRILVPTDGSLLSFEALPLALSFALMHNAIIELFFVDELPAPVFEEVYAGSLYVDPVKIGAALYADMEDFLIQSESEFALQRDTNFESKLVHKGETVPVHLTIEKGISSYQIITEYAAENADMLVMATHGRSGLARLIIGSVAEKVVRRVKVPIITVKPDGSKIADSGESSYE